MAQIPKKFGDRRLLCYVQHPTLSEIIINFEEEQAGVTELKWN